MSHKIGSISTKYIIRLIMHDLETFISSRERKLNFCSESVDPVDELIADWLEWFEEYPKGIAQDELKEIEREIGEYMGSMSIWSHDEDERQEYINKFGKYFGEYRGFLQLFVDVYKEELKDELSY
ncbi:hypothetical protein AB1283_00800 [Bacillus sp. S13(2024)]|uniref:hypothetical protein n=1 Tax=Bacillus sp. S13(2024) TaxID=3162885 RepID=UPI003D1D8429